MLVHKYNILLQNLLKLMHTYHDFIATKTCPSCEFLVVCGQLRAYDRKSASWVGLRVWVGSVWGGSGQGFSNSYWGGAGLNFGGRVRTKNFNPRRTLVHTCACVFLLQLKI